MLSQTMRRWVFVDTPQPDVFSDQDVLAALTAGWNLRADGVRYVPKGAGSYHSVVDIDDCGLRRRAAATRPSAAVQIPCPPDAHSSGFLYLSAPFRRNTAI